MTSIFIGNTPAEQATIRAESVEKKEEIEFIWGYHSKQDTRGLSESLLSTIFSSLITHEEIYLKPTTVLLLIESLGISEVSKLLEQKVLKVAFGLDDFVVTIKPNKLELDSISLEWSSMEGFERRASRHNKYKTNELNRLMQYVDNNSVSLGKEDSKIVTSEISSDLSNAKIRTNLGIESESTNNILPVDVYRMVRLSTIAQGLITQNSLGIESIYQDGYAKDYVNSKLGAFSSVVGNDSVQTFSNVMNLKGIPDIYTLYKRDVITLDDIINYRNTFNGTIFRKWFASENYDEKEVVRTLINNESKEKSMSKFIRFLYPNIAGILNPVLGAASSAFDSYIVGKVLDGWKPSLFLDDVLKRNIDEKVRIFEMKKKREQFVKRFGSVGRNDLCPCQSGKKFKKCHGV
ncbi:SEC-C domain-containing protein [Vibrio diazotrophicus]|uniref:YecA family protein n=1 Tax=Vibrio diazotrophicus TaxID=685 RepID=UPI0022B04E59|nr:SEC-C domain-containing protein [Vibrio diazotrophicus]MCZ4374354.1 SEC-C domain-containing protein [Vibrio diazotrophicus]